MCRRSMSLSEAADSGEHSDALVLQTTLVELEAYGKNPILQAIFAELTIKTLEFKYRNDIILWQPWGLLPLRTPAFQ